MNGKEIDRSVRINDFDEDEDFLTLRDRLREYGWIEIQTHTEYGGAVKLDAKSALQLAAWIMRRGFDE